MSLKDIFIEKYLSFVEEVKPYIKNEVDLFPDIKTIEVSDLVYFLSMYESFDESDLKTVIWAQEVILTDGSFDTVFNLSKNFIDWTNVLFKK